MKVMSYNPSDRCFFIGVTFDEYRQIAAKYEGDTNGMEIEEVIGTFKGFLKNMVKEESEDFSYPRYIRRLYDINELPDICLIVEEDLSSFTVEQYDYPFNHMWNAYSPWQRIKVVEINNLDDLATLKCVEKETDNV